MKTGPASVLIFYSFILLLLGGTVSDFASTWLHFHGHPFWRLSLAFRGVLGGVILLLLIVFYRKWPNYSLWLFLSFIISALSLFYGYAIDTLPALSDYFNSSLQLYKMVYPIMLFVALRVMVTRKIVRAAKLFTVLDIAISIYLFFIFFGLIAGSGMFSTYWDGFRPGFKGIILTQNEATGVILIGIFWFGLRFFSGERHVLFFIVSIMAAFILGTKGAFIGCMPLVGGLFWARYGILKMLPIFSFIMAAFVIFSLVAYENSEALQAAVTLYMNYVGAHFDTNSIQSIIAMLTTGRSNRVISFFPILVGDISAGFIVGGMPISYGSMEIDPIDAFLRGGLIFFILLAVAYWRMFRYSGGLGGRRYKFVLFAVWMSIATTGGHMLMASAAAPMLVVSLLFSGEMGVNREVQRRMIPSISYV